MRGYYRTIKTEAEHVAAVMEIGKLLNSDPDPETFEGGRLRLLALLVQDYEQRNLPTITLYRKGEAPIEGLPAP